MLFDVWGVFDVDVFVCVFDVVFMYYDVFC